MEDNTIILKVTKRCWWSHAYSYAEIIQLHQNGSVWTSQNKATDDVWITGVTSSDGIQIQITFWVNHSRTYTVGTVHFEQLEKHDILIETVKAQSRH